jgi:hypothetical protein
LAAKKGVVSSSVNIPTFLGMLECRVRGMEAGKGDGEGGMQKRRMGSIWGSHGGTAARRAGVEEEMLTNF